MTWQQFLAAWLSAGVVGNMLDLLLRKPHHRTAGMASLVGLAVGLLVSAAMGPVTIYATISLWRQERE